MDSVLQAYREEKKITKKQKQTGCTVYEDYALSRFSYI